MEQQRLVKLGGLLFALSGAITFIATLVHPSSVDSNALQSAMWKPAHMGLMIAQLLALPGLAVLHVRLAKKGGIPALAGYVLAMIGTGLYVSGAFAEAAIMPTAMYAKADFAPFSAVMTQLNLAAAPAFGIGYALTAVASYRSGLLPRAASIMLGAGAVAMNLIALVGSGAALVVALPASGLFFAAAQVWYGVAMTGKGSFLKGVDLPDK